MADNHPIERQILHFLPLAPCLLHLVFAETGIAERMRHTDAALIYRFGYRQKPHRIGMTAGAAAGRLNPAVDFCEIPLEFGKRFGLRITGFA